MAAKVACLFLFILARTRISAKVIQTEESKDPSNSTNAVSPSSLTLQDADQAWNTVYPFQAASRYYAGQPPSFIHPLCHPNSLTCSGVQYTAKVLADVPPPKRSMTIKPLPIKAKDVYNPQLSVNYAFFNGTPESFAAYFAIDAHTGEVTQLKVVPKSEAKMFYINVMARPSYATGTEVTFARLTIEVLNLSLSRHDPVVQASALNGFVEESAAIGTIVRTGANRGSALLQVSVSDEDLQPGMPAATYQYMLNGSGTSYFAIDQRGYVYVNTLALQVKNGETNAYDLTIRAREVDTTPIRTSEPVSIRIQIIAVDNHSPPVFASKAYYATAYAGLPQQSLIRLKAFVKDSKALAQLTYRIAGVSNNGEKLFRYNEETNTLLAIAPLASGSQYRLSLEAVDKFLRKAATTVMVNVVEAAQPRTSVDAVTSIPDSHSKAQRLKSASASQWPIAATFNITINEQIDPGTLIMTLMAENSPPDSTLYRFVGGNEDQTFSIDPRNGRMYTAKRLDREQTPTYKLIIQVTSSGMTTYAEVIISISDTNDNAPVILNEAPIKFTVEEVSGSDIIGRILATDRDAGKNGKISYSLKIPNRFFEVNPTDGTIRRKVPTLDHSNSSEHRMVIVARDHGSPSMKTETEVVIEVADSENKPADFVGPVFAGNYTVAVDENAPPMDVLQVQARYPDGKKGPISYVLIKGDSSLFAVNPTTGVISTLLALNAEKQNKYTLIVGTHQNPSADPSAWTNVVVAVQDMNDNAPIFQASSYSTTISELMPPGSSVVQVSATDRDRMAPNSAVSYRLVGDEEAAQFFEVDQKTGLVTVARSLLGTGIQKFTLSIEARDLGVPSRSAVAVVSVHVQMQTTTAFYMQTTWQPLGSDLRSMKIAFSSKNYSTTIYEAIPPPHFVMTLPMKSAGSMWQPMQCSIVSGDDDGMFQVKVGSGGLCEIETRQKLDRERTSSYDLQVVASTLPAAGDSYSSSSSAMVHIDVLDQNDNRPVFMFDESNSISKTYFAVVDEDAPRLTTVLTVKAVDDDASKNRLITYSLVKADPDSAFFTIDRDTGELMTMQKLRKLLDKFPPFYLFRVQATDSPTFGTPLTSEANVAVNVVNDLNRFVISVRNWPSRFQEENLRKIKRMVSRMAEQRLKRCQVPFLERVDGPKEDNGFAKSATDLVFVAVNQHSKRVCRTAELRDLFTKESVSRLKASSDPSVQFIGMHEMAPVVSSNYGRRLQTSEIILIVVGCFICSICLLGVAILCYYWKRSKTKRASSEKAMLYGVMPSLNPMLISPSDKEYETQMLELAVPDEPYSRRFYPTMSREDDIYTIRGVGHAGTYNTRSTSLSHIYIPPPDYAESSKHRSKRSHGLAAHNAHFRSQNSML
uniref:Cadherin domain-containing protein n=1 Tax=Trichuris muris TaxID=70415 RepID=A0A5S6QZP5_TRIMR